MARDGERALVFRYPSETEPAWVARFRPGSADVSVACSPRFVETVGGTAVLQCSFFGYPLDQVLAMYLLGSRGILLHAAGAIIHGRGMAFSGVSGAGKSTLTGLAAGRPGWEPLSDDRVIVRVGESVAHAVGDPLVGRGAGCGAPLRRAGRAALPGSGADPRDPPSHPRPGPAPPAPDGLASLV